MVFTLTSVGFTTVKVKSLKMNVASIQILTRETYQLMVTITPSSSANKKLEFKSSNIKIATVDQNGMVTGVSAGKADITVKSLSNRWATAKCSVVVDKKVKVIRPSNDKDPYKMPGVVNVSYGMASNDIQNVFDKFTVSKNPGLDYIRETTNVNLVNKFTLPSEGFKQQINLGIASGSLPDVFAADIGTMSELIRNDLLVDMKPYMNLWATQSLLDIYGVDNGVNYLPATRGESLYGLPIVGEALDSRFVVWIRDDWMSNLGLDPKKNMPKTVNQLYDIARRFVYDDPDRNGARDTYGIAMSKDLNYGGMSVNSFLGAFGGYPGVYQKDSNNNYSYLGVADGMRSGLETLNFLYRNNIFKQDFNTMTMDQAYSDVKAGKVGIVIGYLFAPMASFQNVWAETGTNVTCTVMPGANNKPYQYYAPMSSKSYYVVTKNCKNPEAVIKILNSGTRPVEDIVYDDNQGWAKFVKILASSGSKAQLNNMVPILQSVTNVNYSRAKTYIKGFSNKAMQSDPKLFDILGTGQFVNRVYPSYRYQNIPGFYANKANRMDGAKSSLYPEDTDNRRLQHMINWGTYKAIVEGTVTAMEGYKGTPIKNAWYYADTSEMTKYASVLSKKEEEMIFGVITGLKSLKDWDEYTQTWYPQNGGSQVLNSMKNYTAR